MLTEQEITQTQYNSLIEDAQYLEDEAEALKYIIDQVPFTEVPSGGMSILQKLAMIDHAQNKYYRPLIEQVFTSNRVLQLKNYDHYTETFSPPEDEKNVQKVLNKIIKHRAGILNLFGKIPLIDWERAIKDRENKTISLFDFAVNMVKGERQQLKEIADLVLIYQNNKHANRQAKASQNRKTGD